MLIIDVAYNLTFLIAFAVVSGFLDNRYPSRTTQGLVIQGVLFGSATVIGILYPFVLYEGLLFDGRSVAISLATLIFGPITGLIATLMSIVARVSIGGVGLLIGVLLSIFSFVIGLIFRLFWDRHTAPRLLFMFQLGIVVHIGMVALLFLLPTDLQIETFIRSAPTILIFYPIATVIMGKVLSDQLEIRHLLAQVRENEEKFRAIFNSTNEAIFVHDAKTGTIVDFNDRTMELYNLQTREQVHNNFIRNISAGNDSYNPKKGFEYLQKAVELGSFTFDWHARGGDDNLFWVEVSLRHVVINDKGFVIAVVRNIDDRKKQEETTARNLKEKEVLLAEVHHRVKNNLAIISGLIGLQIDTVVDQSAREILDETDKRIRSISLIHELVYNNEQLESVDFGTFLHELIPILDTFSNQQEKNVDMVIDVESVQIDLSKSVPCALITTEIITNCYKHAFKNRATGTITITLKESDELVTLVIEDNGNGADDPAEISKSGSFGSTIMLGLTQQIGGTILFENANPGFRVTLTFNATKAVS